MHDSFIIICGNLLPKFDLDVNDWHDVLFAATH